MRGNAHGGFGGAGRRNGPSRKHGTALRPDPTTTTRAAGVHCMQGYRFGRPMDRSELSARLVVPGTYRTIEGDARETALAS